MYDPADPSIAAVSPAPYGEWPCGTHLQDDEPLFLIRGQDKFASLAMHAYADLLQAGALMIRRGGDDPGEASRMFSAAGDVRAYADDVYSWQMAHSTKVPD